MFDAPSAAVSPVCHSCRRSSYMSEVCDWPASTTIHGSLLVTNTVIFHNGLTVSAGVLSVCITPGVLRAKPGLALYIRPMYACGAVGAIASGHCVIRTMPWAIEPRMCPVVCGVLYT